MKSWYQEFSGYQDFFSPQSSKITSFNDTKGRIIASALGQARGMANTWTWEQVIGNIEGIVNRGNISHTFTPSGSEQSYTVAQGYHGGSGVVKCKAIALSGNAGTGDVLKGKSFYNTSFTKQTGTFELTGNADASHVLKDKTFYKNTTTKQTGTMPSKTSGNTTITTSGQYGFDTTNGMWMYIPENAYYSTSYWLNVPWNKFASLLTNGGFAQVKTGTVSVTESGYKLWIIIKNIGITPRMFFAYASVTWNDIRIYSKDLNHWSHPDNQGSGIPSGWSMTDTLIKCEVKLDNEIYKWVCFGDG